MPKQSMHHAQDFRALPICACKGPVGLQLKVDSKNQLKPQSGRSGQSNGLTLRVAMALENTTEALPERGWCNIKSPKKDQ